MAKNDDIIEVEGDIVEVLPNQMFKVKLDNDIPDVYMENQKFLIGSEVHLKYLKSIWQDKKNKIKNKINLLSIDSYNPKVIAVSKTFKEQDILPLLNYGHCDFGENKVQEALIKWPKLKEEYKDVKFVKVDIDEAEELATERGVMSIPTLNIFNNGEKLDEKMGAMPKSDLKEFIDKNKGSVSAEETKESE